MTGLNALGGEWTTGLQLGTQPRVRTEWFQPLDYGFERFLTLGGAYSRESLSAFDGEGERITEVDITNRQVDLALGTELGVNGEVRLEYVRGYATVDEQIGEPMAPSGSIQSGSLRLQLVHDSLDDTFLPESGGFAGIRGRFERPGLGSDRHFDSVTVMALGTASWRRASITGLLYANAVTKGVAGIENSVLLGGFHRLSAYSQGEVAGEDAALAGVFVRQEFGGPFVPWFAGAGFETGNAWSSLGRPAGTTCCALGACLPALKPSWDRCRLPRPTTTGMTGVPTSTSAFRLPGCLNEPPVAQAVADAL